MSSISKVHRVANSRAQALADERRCEAGGIAEKENVVATPAVGYLGAERVFGDADKLQPFWRNPVHPWPNQGIQRRNCAEVVGGFVRQKPELPPVSARPDPHEGPRSMRIACMSFPCRRFQVRARNSLSSSDSVSGGVPRALLPLMQSRRPDATILRQDCRARSRHQGIAAQPLLPRLSGQASCKRHYVDGWYATTLRAWHIPLIALGSGMRSRWLTKSLNALSRHEKLFPASKTVTVVPAGEEPGEEDSRDDQDDQYDTGDKACPACKPVDRVQPLPSRRIGRIGLRGRSCRFVSGLRR